jgi:predicted nucleic acid-binding protein
VIFVDTGAFYARYRKADDHHARADQRVQFADCVSFVMMRRYRPKRVFGFDRHFAMAGFELWP